jgi:hypothetical protein
MTKRAVQQAKRVDDRRRSGVGDNSPFTARYGASGLGAGKRVSSLVSPTMAKHQWTNRSVGTSSKTNGKGKKTI